MTHPRSISDFSAFLLDLDGVVYRGDTLLPGARELVEWIDATERKVAFVSNNSFATVDEVAAKLARLGRSAARGPRRYGGLGDDLRHCRTLPRRSGVSAHRPFDGRHDTRVGLAGLSGWRA